MNEAGSSTARGEPAVDAEPRWADPLLAIIGARPSRFSEAGWLDARRAEYAIWLLSIVHREAPNLSALAEAAAVLVRLGVETHELTVWSDQMLAAKSADAG